MDAALHGRDKGEMIEVTGVEDSDAALMLRFKAGDADAFDQLFARHMSAVINFAYRFVRDRGSAEELAQEIFLRIYEAADGYEIQAKFTTWLYRIATNVCLNEIRRPRIRAEKNGNPYGFASEKTVLLTDSLEREEISRAIGQALRQLPEKQRAAFILNKYEELSYGEVADIMKISEKAVKSLIHRAKETLAVKLKPLLPGLISI